MNVRQLLCAAAVCSPIAMMAIGFATAPADAQVVVGAAAVHFLSAANTNPHLVKAGRSNVLGVTAINTTATVYYMKFYDKVTAPTCNTDTVKFTLPVPAATSGGFVTMSLPAGITFLNGVGICLTGGIADNDNTNAATGVVMNVFYQ